MSHTSDNSSISRDDASRDGEPEIIAADSRGNVAAFDAHGEEIWSRHVKSLISQGVKGLGFRPHLPRCELHTELLTELHTVKGCEGVPPPRPNLTPVIEHESDQAV